MDTYHVAKLPARLRGFALPDTSTSPEGFVEAGDYLVLEEKARYPTPDTDYARLVVPQLGVLGTWICTRWRTQRYATLASQERAPAMARLSFDDERLAVPEERLTTLLGAFLDYRYDVNRAYYPWALPGRYHTLRQDGDQLPRRPEHRIHASAAALFRGSPLGASSRKACRY
ncbi:hypothetical protein [Corallococcus macrosporus]|uniref:Uncharacterized protein n=1 Tax=Corallococcus macrosporus DSM 14697 TaxID=1189310 RepID=A0A250JTA1_9BACT|nr:hypothetical protein [Corallococcus macrosporus]ATB46336.1 hypothetical protein MYMAC_001928 [Corallococcus macrosporus DSM 14697]